MAFTMECTLEHNEYINEVGQQHDETDFSDSDHEEKVSNIPV